MKTPVRDDAHLVEDYEPDPGTFRIGFKALNVRSVAAAFGSIQRVLLVVARHLMRAIPAERDAAGGRIKPHLSCNNYVLAGPPDADDLPAHAHQLMVDAGVQLPLRSDCIMGLELIFSLHATSTVDLRAYFAACLEWVTDEFSPAPVISAVVHLDEQHPHLHVIVLPLIGSSMQGGKVLGYQGTFKRRQRDFYLRVAKRFGLAEPVAKMTLNKVERDDYANLVVDRLLAGLPGQENQKLVREELLMLIALKPYALGRALGVPLRKSTKDGIAAGSPTDIADLVEQPDEPFTMGGIDAQSTSTSCLCYDVDAAAAAAAATDDKHTPIEYAPAVLPICIASDGAHACSSRADDDVVAEPGEAQHVELVVEREDEQPVSNFNHDTGDFERCPLPLPSQRVEVEALVALALQSLTTVRQAQQKEQNHD